METPPRSPHSGIEDSDSSDDGVLFKFPNRGAFKRKVDEDDSDDSDAGEDMDKSDDSDDEDDDAAFNSSPEISRVRAAGSRGNNDTSMGRAVEEAAAGIDSLESDDDEDMFASRAPPRQPVLDEAAIRAQAEAEINACLDAAGGSDSSSGGGFRGPRNAQENKDRQYSRSLKARLAAASRIDIPTSASYRGASGGRASVSDAVAAAAVQAAQARRNRELSGKRVKVLVTRSGGTGNKHVFKTKLTTKVCAIVEGCREHLLTRTEQDVEPELCLYHQDVLLVGEQTLMGAGMTGNATLRLEVTGEARGCSGPPITLKVRTAGGKTFTVETTKGSTFLAFMEGFCAAVGLPPGRAGDCVFKFDGDDLNPAGTPEGEDMDADDLIDAKIPADLMVGVQAAPSNLRLVARAKPPSAASEKAKGAAKGAATGAGAGARRGGSPGGGLGRSMRSATRATRTRTTRSSGSAAAVAEADIIVLD